MELSDRAKTRNLLQAAETIQKPLKNCPFLFSHNTRFAQFDLHPSDNPPVGRGIARNIRINQSASNRSRAESVHARD